MHYGHSNGCDAFIFKRSVNELWALSPLKQQFLDPVIEVMLGSWSSTWSNVLQLLQAPASSLGSSRGFWKPGDETLRAGFPPLGMDNDHRSGSGSRS